MKRFALIFCLACVALTLTLMTPSSNAQNTYKFARAFAGPNYGGYISGLAGIAVDGNGNIYASDPYGATSKNTIAKATTFRRLEMQAATDNSFVPTALL